MCDSAQLSTSVAKLSLTSKILKTKILNENQMPMTLGLLYLHMVICSLETDILKSFVIHGKGNNCFLFAQKKR